MRIELEGITISLDKDEIEDFYNVVMFALDLDAKEHRMTKAELSLAQKLADVTNIYKS